MDDTEERIKSIGGGSLLIAWQLKDRRVLIVGGGEVASQRIESVLTADALITLVSPSTGLHPRTKRLIDIRPDRIIYHDRAFEGEQELDGVDMVLTALDDNDLSHRIVQMSRQRRIPVNAADIPELCDFYFGAQIRDGPLQIMISTNGNGPRIASLIKTKLKAGLSGLEGEAITKVGILRNRLKERAPGVGGQIGRERMKWMTGLCNEWTLEDFSALNEKDMERLLDEGWEDNRRIPKPEELYSEKAKPLNLPVFPHTLPAAVGFVVGAMVAISIMWCQKR
ncbi:hypothetical protein CVT24_005904 [Panaeolus cyanescens]|uniref:precorrin-2 dehydrogenase n=1 Tax=Panaeolus cyanescens TaxID=181874 RepID=A0A409V8X1_9AGAR|nr:hypothetical protein CVT24_005904 [Panaeolus cyanescens]